MCTVSDADIIFKLRYIYMPRLGAVHDAQRVRPCPVQPELNLRRAVKIIDLVNMSDNAVRARRALNIRALINMSDNTTRARRALNIRAIVNLSDNLTTARRLDFRCRR